MQRRAFREAQIVSSLTPMPNRSNSAFAGASPERMADQVHDATEPLGVLHARHRHAWQSISEDARSCTAGCDSANG